MFSIGPELTLDELNLMFFTPSLRQKYFGNAIDIAISCGFNGLSVNFTNFDSINETDFCDFLIEFNNFLVYKGIEYETSINLTYSIVYPYNPCQVENVCNWGRLTRLKYLFYGGRNILIGIHELNKTSHLSSIQDLQDMQDCFLNLNKFSVDKLVLELPSYGLGYKLVDLNDTGVDAPIYNLPPQWYSYTKLCSLLNENETVEQFWVEEDQSCFLVDLSDGTWVTYENPVSINLKTNWALENGFAGVLIVTFEEEDPLGDCDPEIQFSLMRAALKSVDDFSNRPTLSSLNRQLPVTDYQDDYIQETTEAMTKISDFLSTTVQYNYEVSIANVENITRGRYGNIEAEIDQGNSGWFKIDNNDQPLEYFGGVEGFYDNSTEESFDQTTVSSSAPELMTTVDPMNDESSLNQTEVSTSDPVGVTSDIPNGTFVDLKDDSKSTQSDDQSIFGDQNQDLKTIYVDEEEKPNHSVNQSELFRSSNETFIEIKNESSFDTIPNAGSGYSSEQVRSEESEGATPSNTEKSALDEMTTAAAEWK